MIAIDALIRWAEEHGLPCDVALSGDIAIFSPDRAHRYILTRITGSWERVLVGIGLNPSTANAFENDPTIRRGIGFAQTWLCGLYVMLNSSAYRSTDPRNMRLAAAAGHDVIGEHNDAAIAFVLGLMHPADIALAGWGRHATRDRVDVIRQIADRARVDLHCLGVNQDDSPKHPLYVAGKTQPQLWRAARSAA